MMGFEFYFLFFLNKYNKIYCMSYVLQNITDKSAQIWYLWYYVKYLFLFCFFFVFFNQCSAHDANQNN